jgi:hypothetical protein
MFKFTLSFPTSFLEEELGELLAKAYGQILERAFVVTESFEVFVTTDVFDTIVLAAVVEIIQKATVELVFQYEGILLLHHSHIPVATDRFCNLADHFIVPFLNVANRIHVFLQIQEFIPDLLALGINKGRIIL